VDSIPDNPHPLTTMNRSAAAKPVAPPQRLSYLLAELRPRQWSKNALLFAGVFFAGKLLEPLAFAHALLAFITFCCASSAIYLVNDFADLEHDRQHPRKRARPLAAGTLTPHVVLLAAALLAVIACGLTAGMAALPAERYPDAYRAVGGGQFLFALTLAVYIMTMLAYTFWLKHIVLVDVFTIASGFVMRAMAGAFAVGAPISPWFYLCTVLLALFLALSKRRHELLLLDDHAWAHRQILLDYSPQLLDQLISIVTSATIMAYSLYTFLGETGDHRLMVTIPFVLYGIFRYLYLVYMKQEGGNPEEILLRDRHILSAVVLCTLAILAIIYVLPAIHI
jgi:4-hydroxybenzoate polyprenyltransferase